LIAKAFSNKGRIALYLTAQTVGKLKNLPGAPKITSRIGPVGKLGFSHTSHKWMGLHAIAFRANFFGSDQRGGGTSERIEYFHCFSLAPDNPFNPFRRKPRAVSKPPMHRNSHIVHKA